MRALHGLPSRARQVATLAAAVASVAGPVAARAQAAPPPVIAITGGTVYPVSGPKIEGGTVLIQGGNISAVGRNIPIPAGAERVDATGKWVTPGLINAATNLGLTEAGGPQFSGGYNDTRATGTKGIAAAFNAWEGLNPASTFIPMQRGDGITSVLVAPAGGLIGGRAAMVDLAGATVGAMVVRGPVAMVGAFDPTAGNLQSRGELIGTLRDLLTDARSFVARRAAIESNQTRPLSAPKADLEALQPVLNRTMPLAIAVDRASDITAVLALARQFNIRVALVGAAEAWQVAAEIAAARVPVMVGAMNNIPGSFNTLGMRQENAAMLKAAGVQVTLIGNGPGDGATFNARNIRQEAGNAVAYGMTWDDALRAITLAPAEAFGVGDRIGSLQPGRAANVVVWSGDPFEFETRAERVYIRGALQSGRSRQDELSERYRRLPPNFRTP
ncbi:MAG: amidohydrolase family protein [Gemmatimonadetes bacterium]|nr:amidohydrolase family protein [Gemmatimonadota bacterium]